MILCASSSSERPAFCISNVSFVPQERDALETRSLPMRQYLVDNVLPLLTKGLLEVGRLRPEDPIDFLAEYLFKNDVKAD